MNKFHEKVVGKLKKYPIIMWMSFVFILLLLTSCSNDDDAFSYTGIVESPKQVIYSQVDGQIKEILLKEGEKVDSGDIVSQLEEEFYKYEIDEANAATKAIEHEIKQLEKDNVSEEEIKKYRFELEQAEAKLNQVKYRHSKTEVTTPTEGMITDWFVYPGDFVQIGTPLLSLTLKKPMELTIYVPQNQLLDFTVGDKVTVAAVSVSDDEFEGKVVQIAEESIYSPQNLETTEDKAKKVFPVKIEIEDDGTLKSGMDVHVERK